MRLFTLSILFVVTVLVIAFDVKKCDHVFTQVEQSVIKIERLDFPRSITLPAYSQPTGLHEGMELICVKCFHKQKQALDYGEPEYGPTLTGLWVGIDSCLLIGDGQLTIDTSGYIEIK